LADRFFQAVVNVNYDWARDAIIIVSEQFPDNTYEGIIMLRQLAVLFELLIVIRIDGRARPS
jgi:hypothetical protein